jgi:predicted house-cleaning noncanonical NTP pyrophosphatase (MazG superfamily)
VTPANPADVVLERIAALENRKRELENKLAFEFTGLSTDERVRLEHDLADVLERLARLARIRGTP